MVILPYCTSGHGSSSPSGFSFTTRTTTRSLGGSVGAVEQAPKSIGNRHIQPISHGRVFAFQVLEPRAHGVVFTVDTFPLSHHVVDSHTVGGTRLLHLLQLLLLHLYFLVRHFQLLAHGVQV